jgi:hypothetical protein
MSKKKKKKQQRTTDAPQARTYRWFQDPAAWAIVAAVLVFFIVFALHGYYWPPAQRVMGVDPVMYYAWVHSPLFDGDLKFENEYRALNEGLLQNFTDNSVHPDYERTVTGYNRNEVSLGPGLLWAPFILLLKPFVGGTGFEQPYQAAVFFANTLYALAGVLLMYFTLRTWYDRWPSAVVALAMWACSPALYYTYCQFAMAHACSMFSMALLVFLWVRLREKEGWLPWVWIGAAIGLAALVRWQNVIYCVIPAVDLLWRQRAAGIPKLAVAALTSAVVFFPQTIGWKVLYGSFLTMPQGGHFVDLTKPQVLDRLFATGHGFITWTPLVVVGLVGLFLWKTERKVILVPLAVAFLAQLYVESCVSHIGWSFGMRRLVNAMPLLAVGAAVLVIRPQVRLRWVVPVVAVFALWNYLFVLQYRGYVDTVKQQAAVAQFMEEHGLDNYGLQQVAQTGQLPDGTPFDVRAMAMGQSFPREGSLTFEQLVNDKMLVVRTLLVGAPQ